MPKIMYKGKNFSMGNGGEIDSTLSTSSENPVQNKVVTEMLINKINTSDIADWAKAETKPTYTAEEVGADPVGSSTEAMLAATAYTDRKISDLVGTAPDTLDTIEELAAAYKENQDVVQTLDDAITKKADKETVDTLQTLVDTKQNSLYLGVIGDDSTVDWNTLTETGFYEVQGNPLADDFTHGLEGAYTFGILKIINVAKLPTYQFYINDHHEIYQCQRYSGANDGWRNWKRVDAGNKEDKPYLVPEVSFINKTVAEAKQYILDWFAEQRANKTNGILRFNSIALISKWNNDDYIIPAGTRGQVSILNMYESGLYGLIAIADYDSNVFVVTISNGTYVRPPCKVYTQKDFTLATTTKSGLMSSEDKVKLDSITSEMLEKLKKL